MRLQKSEVAIIKETIHAFDPKATVYLFGSRVDDTKKGGDIDLLIESDVIGLAEIIKIKTKLLLRLGDRKVDIVYRKGAFFYQAKKRALQL